MQTIQTSTQNFKIIIAILIAGAFATFGVGLFSFTIPLASMDERISGAWLGSAFAGYYLAKLLISPVAGIAADRYGPRPILAFAMSAGCLIPFLYFLSPNMKTLYTIQIAMGLISGLIRPVGMASLGSLAYGTHLTSWFAAHSALFSATAFLGPIVGSILYFNRTSGPVLIALAACMGLAALITLIFLPKTVRTQRKEATQTTSPPPSRETTIALFLAIGGRTLGIGLLTAFYPILLANTLGRDGLTIAIIYAIPGLATFLGLTLSSRGSPKRSELDRIAFGMLLSSGSLFILGSCTQLWQFATFGILMGLGAALSIPASMTLASTLTKQQGTVFGAANLASGLGFLMGPLLGGWIVQNFQSLIPAMQTSAVLGMLTCLPLVTIILRDHFHWGTIMQKGGTGFLAIILFILNYSFYQLF